MSAEKMRKEASSQGAAYTTTQKEAWHFDTDRVNLSPRLEWRYHGEGWCLTGAPSQVVSGLVAQSDGRYPGTPNNFDCPHCGKKFRRVEVSPEEAKALRATWASTFAFAPSARSDGRKKEDRSNFDGVNGLKEPASSSIATEVHGCSCVSGAEHRARNCSGGVSEGTVKSGYVVLPLTLASLTYRTRVKVSLSEQMKASAPKQELHAPLSRGETLLPTGPENGFLSGEVFEEEASDHGY